MDNLNRYGTVVEASEATGIKVDILKEWIARHQPMPHIQRGRVTYINFQRALDYARTQEVGMMPEVRA